MKLASFEAIVKALNGADVRYLVAGGLAVVAHGYGRLTFDVDIVLQLQSDNVYKAMQALETLGYRPFLPVKASGFADADTRRQWIEEKNMVVFQLFSDDHPQTRIDFFVEEPFDFDEEYKRALAEDLLPGVEVRFVGIDALIRMKAAADREKDREDIRQLKMLQRDTDDEQ